MATTRGKAGVADRMQTYPTESGRHATTNESGADREASAWQDRSRIVLTPIAAPSILGLYGFFAATIMVGTNLAGLWGNEESSLTLFTFAFVVGGIAQFLAGMWAYRARDGLATAMHGVWGSFWIAYGIQHLLQATHVLKTTPLTAPDKGFAMWFVALAAITAVGAIAGLTESLGLGIVLAPLAAGSVLFAIGLWGGNISMDRTAGWLFVIAAIAAWYVASAMMLASTTGRTIRPLGKYNAAANVPGRAPMSPIEYAEGEPGVKAGQ
jgi:succinate-acetate transporter protein